MTKSIRTVLFASIALALLVLTAFLFSYSYFRLDSIISNMKEEDFAERLRIITESLENQNRDLEDTGLVEIYQEDFQSDIIDTLRSTYYTTEEQTIYPFIIDAEGTVVMHPSVETGSTEVQDASFVQYMIEQKNGTLDYSYNGEERWSSFRYFEPWDWVVAYGLNRSDKTAERNAFLQSLVVSMLFATSVIVAIVLVVTGRMLGPLRLVNDRIQAIAEGGGDLTEQVIVRSKNETGQLAKAFNDFVGTLREIVRHIKMVGRETESVNTELAENTTTTASAVNQISVNVSSMKERISLLDDKIDSSASSMERMANTASSLNKEIENHASMVTQSTAAVNEMIASLKQVAQITKAKQASTTALVNTANQGGEKLENTNTIIEEISSNVNQIQEMVELINSIAAQTNLLAMNAAIEAAHAGESGKGFAVVAAEIRKLAETSALNSKNIETVLKSIIGRIQSAYTAGVETRDAFKEIDKEVVAVAGALQEITSSTNELAVGGEELLKSMSILSEVAINVKRGADEVSEVSTSGSQHLTEVRHISAEVTTGMDEIVTGVMSINQSMQNITSLNDKLGDSTSSLMGEINKFKTEKGVEND